MTKRQDRETTTAIALTACELDWRDAYEEHAPDLVRFLRRFTRDEGAARDLVHDTFIHAMRAPRRPTQSELRPWLFRIASNLAIDDLRRRRRFAFLPLKETIAVSGGPSYAEIDHVRRALQSIAPEQALTLTLALHDGFSRREIGEITGVSEETVKSRMRRGRLEFAAAYQRIERGLAR